MVRDTTYDPDVLIYVHSQKGRFHLTLPPVGRRREEHLPSKSTVTLLRDPYPVVGLLPPTWSRLGPVTLGRDVDSTLEIRHTTVDAGEIFNISCNESGRTSFDVHGVNFPSVRRSHTDVVSTIGCVPFSWFQTGTVNSEF